MKDKYDVLPPNSTQEAIQRWISDVTRARNVDIDDYERQESTKPAIFPVPSSSSDLIGTEKAGDIAVDASYFYIVADNSGTLAWRRVAISSF